MSDDKEYWVRRREKGKKYIDDEETIEENKRRKQIQKKVDDAARNVPQRPPEQLRVKPSHEQCSSFPYGPENSRRLTRDCKRGIDEKMPFTRDNVRSYATQMVEEEVCEAVKFIYTRENFASREEVKKVLNDLINCHNSINDPTYEDLQQIVGDVNLEENMSTALNIFIDVSNHHRCFLRKILCAFPVSAKLVCALLDYICIYSLDRSNSESLVTVINSAKGTICRVCRDLKIELCIRTIMVMHVYAALSVLQLRATKDFQELRNPFLVRIMQVVSLNPNLIVLMIIPTDASIFGKLNQWLGVRQMTINDFKLAFSKTVKSHDMRSIIMWIALLVISVLLILNSGEKLDDITLSGFTKDVVKQYQADERSIPVSNDVMLDNAISDILLVPKDKQDYYTRRVYYPWMVFAGSLLAGAGGGPPAALVANVVGTFAASFLGTGTFGMGMVGTGLSGMYLDSPGNTKFAHLPLPGDDYYPERNAQSKQIQTLVKRKQEEAVQKATQFAIRTMNETVSWEKSLRYWALWLGPAYFIGKLFNSIFRPSTVDNLTLGKFHEALNRHYRRKERNFKENNQMVIETIMVDRALLVSVGGLNAKVNEIVNKLTSNMTDRIEEQVPYSDSESDSDSE